MNAKKWTISFVAIILACILAIMSINYFYDPYKYFSAQHGDDYTMDEDDYLRELKAEHIKYYGDQYDAYLICGSKGGAVKPSKLKELDGYNYYNCWVLSGNFPDYLAYAKYIVENTNAKKILLQISSSELYELSREDKGTIYEVPAVLSGESKFIEVIQMLMKNPKITYDELTAGATANDPNLESGERNLQHYYDFQSKDLDAYYKYVMDDSKSLYRYFTKKAKGLEEISLQCLAILREIKALCEENDVELQVYFASLFEPQIIKYDGDAFYSIMEEVVMLMDEGEKSSGVWNFNTYNKVALCPYNYYNASHFYYEIADLMVDTMAGKECPYEGFGQYLTRENIGKVIKERKKSYNELKDYYEKNQTLPFEGYDSKYNVVKGSKYFSKN